MMRLRLMHMRRGRAATSLTVVVVVGIVVLVVVAALVVIEPRTLLEIVILKTSAPLMTSMLPSMRPSMLLPILLELSIVVLRRTRHGLWRRGLRISLVRSWRIRARALMRSVWLWWVAITHWSNRVPGRTVVKTHPDWRTHGLGFGRLVVMSSPTSGSAILLLMRLVLRRVRGGGRRGSPLLLRRTTWLLLWGVRLPVRLLGRRSTIGRLLLRVLGAILRLLLLLLLLVVEVLSVVGVIVLRGQRGLARVLWVLRLSLVGPLLLVLGISSWARLGVLSVSRWILSRVLRCVWLSLVLRWLLRVAIRGWSLSWGRSIVSRPASCLVVVTSSASSATTMTRVPTTTSTILVWRILRIATCRSCRRGCGWRRTVVVSHGGKLVMGCYDLDRFVRLLPKFSPLLVSFVSDAVLNSSWDSGAPASWIFGSVSPLSPLALQCCVASRWLNPSSSKPEGKLDLFRMPA